MAGAVRSGVMAYEGIVMLVKKFELEIGWGLVFRRKCGEWDSDFYVSGAFG